MKQYKVRKNCAICSKVFYPSYAGSLYCDSCKKGRRVKEEKNPVKKAPKKPVKKEAVKKGAKKISQKPVKKQGKAIPKKNPDKKAFPPTRLFP